MAKPMKALTAMGLAALKPEAVPYYVKDIKADGLRVRVAPSGALSWSLVVRIKGGPVKSVSLGPADPDGRKGLDLGEARERATAIVRAARAGRDLVAEEQVARKAAAEAAADVMTVADLIDRYGKAIAAEGRRGGPLRTAPEITRRLKRALATNLDASAESIERKHISRALDDEAEAHPREAEKRRQVIHAMFAWAVSKGFADINPAAGVPGYSPGATRDRALSPDEIRALWEWLDGGAERMPPDVIACLRLQLCTGARIGEVSGIDASELERDDDKRLIWTLPAERSKNKKPRVTPLVGRARAIVEAAMKARPRGALFRTLDFAQRLTATNIGNALVKRADDLPVGHFTTHDLRRTVVSQMDEMGIALDTIAAVVGHQRGTRATQTLIRHYSRPKLDDRVEAALTAWDKRLTAIVEGRDLKGDNVVSINAA